MYMYILCIHQPLTSISFNLPQLNTPQQPTHHLHRTPQLSTSLPTSHRPTCPPAITPATRRLQTAHPPINNTTPHTTDSPLPCSAQRRLFHPARRRRPSFSFSRRSHYPAHCPRRLSQNRAPIGAKQVAAVCLLLPLPSSCLFVACCSFACSCWSLGLLHAGCEVPGQLGTDKNAAHGS